MVGRGAHRPGEELLPVVPGLDPTGFIRGVGGLDGVGPDWIAPLPSTPLSHSGPGGCGASRARHHSAQSAPRLSTPEGRSAALNGTRGGRYDRENEEGEGVDGGRSVIDPDQLAAICQRYGIRELALFGPVLRDDFTPYSDVDVLYDLSPTSPVRSLLDIGWIAVDL